MIDITQLTGKQQDALVRYTPAHGKSETGILSSWNEEHVFVRYGGNATGTATRPADLAFVTEYQVAMRGWKDGKLVYEEIYSFPVNDESNSDALGRLAEQHALKLEADKDSRHMMEIEFLDEPNPEERYYRWGTDPGGMVRPAALDWEP